MYFSSVALIIFTEIAEMSVVATSSYMQSEKLQSKHERTRILFSLQEVADDLMIVHTAA